MEIHLLNEFSQNEQFIGVMLQEMTVTAAEPKIMSDTGSVVRFSTVLQDSKPNRNKRIYSEQVLSEAITRPRVQELLATRTMYGEANHPFDPSMQRQMVIDQTRISHIVTGITPPSNGQPVVGMIETAATSCGRDMRGLIVENKSTVAFSMRGMGGVRRVPGKDQLVEVTSPLQLFTYDWVTFPSHASAYMPNSSVQREGAAVVTRQAAMEYAVSQSKNAKMLVEQMQLEGATFNLAENCMDLIVQANGGITAKVFLEADIRTDFRKALLGL